MNICHSSECDPVAENHVKVVVILAEVFQTTFSEGRRNRWLALDQHFVTISYKCET